MVIIFQSIYPDCTGDCLYPTRDGTNAIRNIYQYRSIRKFSMDECTFISNGLISMASASYCHKRSSIDQLFVRVCHDGLCCNLIASCKNTQKERLIYRRAYRITEGTTARVCGRDDRVCASIIYGAFNYRG